MCFGILAVAHVWKCGDCLETPTLSLVAVDIHTALQVIDPTNISPSRFHRGQSFTSNTMPSFGTFSSFTSGTTTKPRPIIIFDPDPNFDGPDDVVMEDVEDHAVPMDIDEEIGIIPDKFKCCITLSIMKDPWIDPEGNSYEREAILTWLDKHSESPLTRQPLWKGMLQPNTKLRDKIQAFCRDNPKLV